MHYKAIKIYPNISLHIDEKMRISTTLRYTSRTTILQSSEDIFTSDTELRCRVEAVRNNYNEYMAHYRYVLKDEDKKKEKVKALEQKLFQSRLKYVRLDCNLKRMKQ